MKYLIVLLGLVLSAFGVEVKVYAIVKGKVEKVYVREGQRVKKGDLLMKIDPSLYEAERKRLLGRKKEIWARLWKVEKDYRRLEELFNRDLLAESRLEVKKSEYESLKAQIEQVEGELMRVETLISYTEIRSPINGRVKKVLLPEGSYVNGTLQPHPVLIIQSERR